MGFGNTPPPPIYAIAWSSSWSQALDLMFRENLRLCTCGLVWHIRVQVDVFGWVNGAAVHFLLFFLPLFFLFPIRIKKNKNKKVN